jgi:hypothetical protein
MKLVYKGKSVHELNVNPYKAFPQFYNVHLKLGTLISIETAGGCAAQGNIGVKFPISHNFHIEAVYYLWNKKTLDGDRNIPNAEKRTIDHELVIGISAGL